MKRFENWVNVAASIGVILGILFLGLEISQNTEMMRSQARDSITDKQMMFSEWVSTEPQMAAAIVAAGQGLEKMDPQHFVMYSYFMAGVWREWENSYYQFEQGLLTRPSSNPAWSAGTARCNRAPRAPCGNRIASGMHPASAHASMPWWRKSSAAVAEPAGRTS